MSTPTSGPGLPRQAGVRTAFRVAGVVLTAAGLLVFGWGVTRVFGQSGFAGPQRGEIAAFIGGLPLLGVGLMLLQAGFAGAAARYAAGETMPVVRDSAAYLTDGEGLLGVGRTVDDAPPPAAGAGARGPFCSRCGTRNDGDARFCDSCGHGLG